MNKNNSVKIVMALAIVVLVGIAVYFVLAYKSGTNTRQTTPTSKTVTSGGFYSGDSSAGACQLKFAVQVTGTTFTGTATGTGKDISCIVTLNGTTDNLGNVNGEANGTYTTIIKGVTFEWYLSGPVSGALNKQGGNNLVIDLKGNGHKCPANIPCEDPSDKITATLENSVVNPE